MFKWILNIVDKDDYNRPKGFSVDVMKLIHFPLIISEGYSRHDDVYIKCVDMTKGSFETGEDGIKQFKGTNRNLVVVPHQNKRADTLALAEFIKTALEYYHENVVKTQHNKDKSQ